jgi:hypothetical protein
MHFKDDDEVAELVRGFETCEIHPAEFKHYQHLAVALWYVKQSPYEEASEKMRKGIQRLAAAYGKTGYHETITLFWLQVVNTFFVNTPAGKSLVEMANELANRYGNKNLIANYYSEERIASVEAKHGWVEPDLKALEFD